jgi:hypothetical protein
MPLMTTWRILTAGFPQLQSVSARVSSLLDRLLEQRKGRLQVLQARAPDSELLRRRRVLLAAALQNQAQIRGNLHVVRPQYYFLRNFK